MLTALLLVCLAVLVVASNVHEACLAKKAADARRRESMRRVTEKWHFRKWEDDFRSSDSL